MIIIQTKLLNYLDSEADIEELFDNLTNYISEQEIVENRNEMKAVLHLISKIAENHFRGPNFFNKIKQILDYFKGSINKNFKNIEIFDIFKKCKMILLLLLQEQIFHIDSIIYNIMIKNEYLKPNYQNFFYPELEPYIVKEIQDKKLFQKFIRNLPDDFYEKRKIGENSSDYTKLIREDLIEEFIIYVNKNDLPLNSTIKSSIYETNSFLEKNNSTLIEYAAFFGSVQIFKYLYLNDVELKPSLWIYGIHGNNEEIIHILVENHIMPKEASYEICFKEAIKCHHNDMAIFITNNLLEAKILNKKKFAINQLSCNLKYYNFALFQDKLDYNFIFYYACKYDHLIIVESILKAKQIDIYKVIISTNFFLIQFLLQSL